jgi:GTP diphosphokinase / guanosine-3',5'-bis(diphosphate) 3'-diphosphatase
MDRFLDLPLLRETFLNYLDDFPNHEHAMLEEALEVATRSHDGQLRDEGTPYVIHLIRTALILIEELRVEDAEMIAAALLHDSVEDTAMTITELQERFGDSVAKMVEALTRDKSKESKKDKFEKLLHENEKIRTIKSADWFDNMRSWKFISPERPAREKFSRWFEEAENLYIPLAESVDESLGNRMREELMKAKHA